MPRTCKAGAPLAMESEVLTSRQVPLDAFTVGFEGFHVDADGTPMFKGLPDDRCQCPHHQPVTHASAHEVVAKMIRDRQPRTGYPAPSTANEGSPLCRTPIR
jgi:hypothetical protein